MALRNLLYGLSCNDMSNHYLKVSTFYILAMSSSFIIMPMVSPLFWDNSINKWWNLLQSTKNTYLNHKIVTRVKKPNTNYCTFTIIIWLFRSVVYLWHLTCIPYEVMPIQFFDWLTTYISNSRVHIFITLVLIIMNKWKDANIC